MGNIPRRTRFRTQLLLLMAVSCAYLASSALLQWSRKGTIGGLSPQRKNQYLLERQFPASLAAFIAISDDAEVIDFRTSIGDALNQHGLTRLTVDVAEVPNTDHRYRYVHMAIVDRRDNSVGVPRGMHIQRISQAIARTLSEYGPKARGRQPAPTE